MPPNLIIMVENRNNLNNKIVLCYLNAILLYSNTMTKAGHFKIVRKPEVDSYHSFVMPRKESQDYNQNSSSIYYKECQMARQGERIPEGVHEDKPPSHPNIQCLLERSGSQFEQRISDDQIRLMR